jgi:putative transposase
MARRSRLVLPGLAHYVLLRGHRGARVMFDAVDEEAFLAALHESMSGADIVVHAFALLDNEVHLLLRPGTPEAMGRVLQTLGRRYVRAFNQRHQCSGTLWDGRYRAAVVEPGEMCLFAMRRIAQLGAAETGTARGDAQALDAWRRAHLVDPPELWALGNTPFEREARWRELQAQELSPRWLAALGAAVHSGRVFGTPAYVHALARDLQRPLGAARRGRPSRNAHPLSTLTP